MDFTASQKITKTTVTPVSNSPQLPRNLTPGFYSAYDAIYKKQEADERKKEKKDSNLPAKQDKSTDSAQAEFPEIFELLNTYRFKDFLQLMMSGDDAQMMLIIKKERASRGVEQAVALSDRHRNNDDYINETGSKYRNASWLMEAKPGKTYTGTL